MSKIADSVYEFLKPIADELGYEIVDVEFAKKYNGDNLTIFIDKAGGVTLEDCEKFHTAIDAPLDELNPTADKPYTLNVSSAGLDRPIKTDADFGRNLDEMVEVRLYEAQNKKKLFVGKLVKFDESSITLEIDGKEEQISRKLISKATKYIDF